MYGRELILDLHGCPGPFTRKAISVFMVELCDLLGMARAELHFWDYDDVEERAAAPAHLAGISAVQFITTSNVTIHTLDKLGAVYLNIFTCAALDRNAVEGFCMNYWKGEVVESTLLARQ